MILSLTNTIKAQLPQYYNYNTPGSANSFPFNITGGKQVQWLYLPGELNQPTPPPAGILKKISFRLNENYAFGPWTYSNFLIRLGQSSVTTFTTGNFYNGVLDTVYYKPTVTFTGTPGQWLTITLDSVFNFNPSLSLIVSVSQCGVPGASGYAMCQTGLSGLRRNYSTGGCPFTISGNDNNVAHIGLEICTGAITPSNTTAASNQSVCAGNATTLTAVGSGTLGWFTSSVGGSYLGSGNSFATPILTTSTTYYVQDSTACNSSTRTAITITVNPKPTVSASSGTICNGSSFTISPSGANTYTIQGGNYVVTPTTSTNYTIAGTSTAGCVSAPLTVTVVVSPCTGVNANLLESVKVNVYPNPSNGLFTIESNASEVKSITVTDVNGKLIEKINVQSNTETLDIRKYDDGVYFINVSTSFGDKTIKIIKSK